jgi:replicative DNA helicase
MKTSLNKLIFEYQLEINHNPDENQKTYSGLSKLDFNTQGFSRGTVNIIAARKGNAMMAFKNQLLSSSIFKTTIISKKNVNNFMYSLLSHKSCISEKKIAHKFFQEHELMQLNKSLGELQNLPVYIKKKKKLTLDYLEYYLEKHNEIESIIIKDLGAFIEKEVLILTGLKQLAKKYNILLFAFYELSSVNKDKSYKEIQPNFKEFNQKFSLKKTNKNIDNLILIFRPELYNINHFCGTEISTENKAEFIIYTKNKERKSILVGFCGAKSIFYDIGIDESNWVQRLKSLTE